jgi:hypothetical protein
MLVDRWVYQNAANVKTQKLRSKKKDEKKDADSG